MSEQDWAEEMRDKMDGNVCADTSHGPVGEDAWRPRFKLDCSECFKQALRDAKEEGRREIMALAMMHSRLCPFGMGHGAGEFGDRWERTACWLGSPGCACDDECESIRALAVEEED